MLKLAAAHLCYASGESRLFQVGLSPQE